jgi:hypothetical protein
VVAFTDAHIRAIVHSGELSDEAAEQQLADVIMKRRNRIAAVYLPAVNPIVSPRLDDGGTLTFRNAAVDAGQAEQASAYQGTWFRFDNATGNTTPLGESRGADTTLKPPASLPSSPGAFVEIDITAESSQHPAWGQPVKTFFRRTSDGWKLVGLERLPERTSAAAQGDTKKGTK